MIDASAYLGSGGGLQFEGDPLPSSRLGSSSFSCCIILLGYFLFNAKKFIMTQKNIRLPVVFKLCEIGVTLHTKLRPK
jgi:hypothetical protein